MSKFVFTHTVSCRFQPLKWLLHALLVMSHIELLKSAYSVETYKALSEAQEKVVHSICTSLGNF